MGGTRKFILNAVLLSAVSIAVRFVSVSFNAHIAVKVGAECIGLFTLVSSVYGLSMIIASAGVNLAVVRRVSEAAAKFGNDRDGTAEELKRILRSSIVYCLVFGTATGGALFALAPQMASHLLNDARCTASLKAFAIGLPAIALSSCVSGYFTGVGKIYKNALCTAAEQAARILSVSAFLVLAAPRGIEYACLAIVGGGVAADVISAVLSYVLYKSDGLVRGRRTAKGAAQSFRRTASLALPVAVGNVARNGLITAEHLAIPRGLRSFGLDSSAALSVYGIMSGMVLPVVLFPSAVLYSFAALLVPELSACRAVGNTARIKNIGEAAFRSSMLFSICVAGILVSYSHEIGVGLYKSEEAARQLRLIAPLVPVMYLDSAVDGMLKGLGEEVYCMKVNVADSFLCLALVFVLVPSFGIDGYIALTIISEVINAALSIIRLFKVAPIKADIVKWIVCPTASIVAATLLSSAVSRLIPGIPVPVSIAIAVATYGVGCVLSGAARREDARRLVSVFKKKGRRASLSA